MLHLGSTATELSHRLCHNFPRGEWGGREVLGGAPILQKNLQVRGYLLLCEFFHRHLGHGLAVSHQTGWTPSVSLLQSYARAREGQHRKPLISYATRSRA